MYGGSLRAIWGDIASTETTQPHSLPILCPTDPESPHQRVVLLRPGDAGDEFFN